MRSATRKDYTPTDRAFLSGGASEDAVYLMASKTIAQCHQGGGVLCDVGCGSGRFWPYVKPLFDKYVGVDLVPYDGFPSDAQFFSVDLNSYPLDLPAQTADVVVALETIEHLENPRGFAHELTRLVRPGGWLIVSTPNQLSLLSLLTLVVKRRFNQFQDIHYPAHLTALLEIDLLRIARECDLVHTAIHYSQSGRIVLTPWHYPRLLTRLLPRLTSDNLLLVGQSH
jgi:SAM-dependent methyltransferase